MNKNNGDVGLEEKVTQAIDDMKFELGESFSLENPSLHMVPMSVIAVMISLNANYVKTLNYDEN